MTKAWMLRQDGEAWEVKQHLYVMNDDDLSSEAEVASFLIYSDSDDKDYCEYVLDAWMGMLIEYHVDFDSDSDSIDEMILNKVRSTPYQFPFPLSSSKLLEIHHKCNNFTDTGELYDFLDNVRDHLSEIQTNIKQSLNQQFCRVRAGGKYNDESRGRNVQNYTMWFRISSVNYNWANTIYIFVADHYRGLQTDSIFICRDYESDNGDDYSKSEYFYKAKDGVPYYNMPIDEYLTEEHEHSPVFSSSVYSGVVKTIKEQLSNGKTYLGAVNYLTSKGVECTKNIFASLITAEQRSKCIDASYLSEAPTRTQMRLRKVTSRIVQEYDEIESVDILEVKPRANRNGKMTASEVIFEIESDIEELDHLQLGIILSRGIGDATPDTIFRAFKIEYDFYKQSKGL